MRTKEWADKHPEKAKASASRARAWRQANPERVKEYRRRWRCKRRAKRAELSPEQLEQLRAYQRERFNRFRAEHPERHREYQRDYHWIYTWQDRPCRPIRIEQLARFFSDRPHLEKQIQGRGLD